MPASDSPAPWSGGRAQARIRRSSRVSAGRTSGWIPLLRFGLGLPPRPARGRGRRVLQLGAVQGVLVHVHDDRVAVLDERDRAAQRRLGRHVADDQSDRAAGETGVGHQRDGDAALAAQRGDPRGRDRASRACPARRAAPRSGSPPCRGPRTAPAPWPAPRSAPARCRRPGRGRRTGRPAMPPSTPASLITAPPSGREVAAEHPQAAGRLERRRQRMDDLAVGRGRVEPGDLPGQGLAGAGDAARRRAARRRAARARSPAGRPCASMSTIEYRPNGRAFTSTGRVRETRLNSSWVITSRQ